MRSNKYNNLHSKIVVQIEALQIVDLQPTACKSKICSKSYAFISEAVLTKASLLYAKPPVLQDLRGHFLGHVVTLLSKL